MKKILSVILLTLLVLLPLTACRPKPIELAMGYVPDLQFAPLYVAAEKGYFRDAGLDITFTNMDENQAVALVGAGKLQFAIVSGEQVPLARAQGLPVVYVAAWYQKYPVSVIAKADSGITTPADLRGRTIGLPGLYGANYIGLDALLFAGGLKESDVTLDSIGYTQHDAFAAGRDPVVSVYTANEPITLRSEGYPLTELRVGDYANLVANGLITNEKTIADNPNLVKHMVKAFLQGLQYTIDHPDEAYQISKGYVENLDQLDPAVEKQILAASIELWKADRLGYSDPQAWTNMQKLLLDMGMLKQPLDLSKAFTNEFLP
jgi:NitT/TauT family transport system substrate-binding protein